MTDPSTVRASLVDHASVWVSVAAGPIAPARKSRWLRLVYSQSFGEPPVRFLLRLATSTGVRIEHVMPAPVLGQARWLGLLPADCHGFEILSCGAVAASFRLDRIAVLSTAQVASAIASENPMRLPAFVLSLVRGEPRTRMLRALTALDLRPLSAFDAFARRRTRPIDERDHILDAGEGRPIEPVFIIMAEGAASADLDATLRSLRAQADGVFRVEIVGPVWPHLDGSDSRFSTSTHFSVPSESPDAERWIAEIKPGDTLAPEAVLAIRRFVVTSGGVDIVYTDSALIDGARSHPILRPDWSPAFHAGAAYVDRLWLVRARLAGAATLDPREGLSPCLDRLLLGAHATGLRVAHLRRILIRVPAATRPSSLVREERPVLGVPGGTASIIIPTRDRVELLRTAIDSLRTDRAREGVEIVVVDNGSTEPACLDYLKQLRGTDGVVVLDRPGPFNFSSLVNAGAARATGDVLVLLNNDCAVLHDGWLAAMTSLARIDDVGAVGAKLLYDDGRLQHAGVGIGLGGEAGHRDRGLSADYPGYLERLRVVHETSAITAACLAVEARVFHAVGGFDEAFAVAFNDIDFCLRLRAWGLRNLFTPHATLRHSESVSRGSDRHPSRRERWSREAALFRQRWQHVILDDPYLHPLLSPWRFRDVLQ